MSDDIIGSTAEETPIDVLPESEEESSAKETKSDHKGSAGEPQKPSSDEDEEGENKAVKVGPAKRVGFAEAPIEDLREHHFEIRSKEEERKKYNPFHKIAPEFSYLEKKAPAPRRLPTSERVSADKPSTRESSSDDTYDTVLVKDFSVQNRESEINFHFPTIRLPLPSGTILVDVKYVTFDSYDIWKMKRYSLNVSTKKVVFGHSFVGKIMSVSNSLSNGEYKVGDKVFGLTDPIARKGTLSSAVLINPRTDVMVKIDDETEAQLADLDVQIKFERKAYDDEFSIDEESSQNADNEIKPTSSLVPRAESHLVDAKVEIPSLAKLTVFPLHFCRAKQVLERCDSIIKKTGKANILINGADTNLGLTLIQLLNSSIYSDKLTHLNLILVVREANKPHMENFLSGYEREAHYDASKKKLFTILTFDLQNDSIVLPKERIPVNYKKPNFFAAELINAIFRSHSGETPLISKTNVNDYKLDMIVDIVGSKMFLQKTSISYANINTMNLPFRNKLDPGSSIESLFDAATKEPFLVKLLKPKSHMSSFVSCCDFNIPEPSYSSETLFTNTASAALNLYSSKWSANLANNSLFAKYNYHDECKLRISKGWVEQGLALFLKGQLHFRIDLYKDWRSNLKSSANALRKNESSIVLKIEDF